MLIFIQYFNVSDPITFLVLFTEERSTKAVETGLCSIQIKILFTEVRGIFVFPWRAIIPPP